MTGGDPTGGDLTGGDPRVARGYDRWFDRPWGHHAWSVESTALLRRLPLLDDRLVVDVGCGTGRLLAELTRHGARAVGLDRDPAMLAVAAPRAAGRLIRADAAALPLPDGVADAAVAVAVLEFTTDPAAVLAELARITRPGGVVVVATLNPRSPWGWLGRIRRRDPYRRARFLTRRQLRRLGKRHGSVRLDGVLLAAESMPWLPRWGPALEAAGRLVPALGAVRLLTITRPGELSGPRTAARPGPAEPRPPHPPAR